MGYYPFEENEAGLLRDNHATAEAIDYLLADNEIVTLAKDVLDTATYNEAENIAILLTGKKRDKDQARRRLVNLVKPPPKRPIYYAQHEIMFLPRWTRDALRDLGDYIDMMVKSAVYEKTQDRKFFNVPLGPAIKAFSQNWPLQNKLSGYLEKYNQFLYRPAKHDFKLPPNRKQHRFTAREVVLSAYVTMQLGKELAKLSNVANAVKNDQPIN